MNALTKTSVIVALGVVICISMTVWLLLPSLENLNALNKDLSQSKSEAVSLEQQIQAYQTAESDLKKATDKQRIYDAILNKEDLVDVIKQTESAIQKSGTTELQLSINDPFLAAATGQPATKNPKQTPAIVAGLNSVTPVSYQLNLENDYIGFINLFSYLEHLPNFTEISSFQLTAETGQGTEGKPAPHTGVINANINAIYFAQKDASTKN